MKGESGSPHLSYAARRQEELSKVNKQTAVLLDNPNNTLAVEYCRFLLPLGMRPLAVLRQGAAHDARAPHSGFASASLLRAHLRDGDFAFCVPFLPPAARAVWKKAADCGEAPVALPKDTLLALLRTALYQGRLRTGSADGFDERLRKAVYTAHSFSDAVRKGSNAAVSGGSCAPCAAAVLCSVWRRTHLSPRLYLRVLALSPRGRSVLKTASLPVIVKPVTEKTPALKICKRRSAAMPFADDLFRAWRSPLPVLRIGGGHFPQNAVFCLR